MQVSKPKFKIGLSVLISLFSIILAVLLGYTDTLQTLEMTLLNLRFEMRGELPVEDNPIVIIAIDDASDEATPDRWPWPRSYFAHVIENLVEAGAEVVGIDVIFDQPDKYGPEQDDELADVLEKHDNVVMVGKLLQTGRTYTYTTVIPPYDKFTASGTPWGLVAIEADMDGFYRRYLPGSTYNDTLLPSFVSEILRVKEGLPPADGLTQDDKHFYLGDYTIPKYDIANYPSSMLINFAGPAQTFQYYSFVNVYDDEDVDLGFEYDLDAFDDPGDPELGIPPGLKYSGQLDGKIVLIGATMQELHDNFPTPFLEYRDHEGKTVKAEMPGVEIHANALLTILQENYLKELSFTQFLLIILGLAIAVFFISKFLQTTWSALSIILLGVVYIFLAFYMFIGNNFILPVVTPVLVMFFGFSGHTLYQFLLTQQEKKMLRGAFAYYVPEEVVKELINNPEKLTLGGEERIVSVMFSDVAGFTSISEKLTPHELVVLLNEYLTAMTDIVIKHRGIIDKYEGDAIMAEFGVPVEYPDHPQAACRTALEMQQVLRELRKKWASENRPQLQARIGINTGEVIVGNMGSQNVFDYTVMGDHVNLGARLESANKFYGTYIMISEFTHKEVENEFYTRPLDLIRVKGKEKPIEVFELISERNVKLSSKYLEMLEVYTKGIQAYRKQQWREAIDFFEYCLRLYPADQPSKLYRRRCIDFRLNSPGKDWDGVFTMTEK